MSAVGAVGAWASRARGRLRAIGGQILQAAAAAGIAWQLATSLLHLPQTIFAPFAAMVALLGGVGGRGRRALMIALGVTVGVATGELLLLVVRPNLATVALAALLSLTVVALFAKENLLLNHGAIASIIVLGMGDPASGPGRLGSAAIGGAVALLFTQVLFTPSPVRLVTAAAGGLLTPVAAALAACARSLDTGDPAPAARAGDELRGHADDAGGLDALRASARSTTRYTLRGHRERARFATVDARTAHVPDLWAEALALCGVLGRAPRHDPHAAGLLAALADLAAELGADPGSEPAAAHTRVAAAYSGVSDVPLVGGVAATVRAVAGDPAAVQPDRRVPRR